MSASKLSLSTLIVGAKVITGVGPGKKGVIMFIGETQFSSGEWIGIRLDTPDGKNDGSVGDTRYFECEQNHGLFARRVCIISSNSFNFLLILLFS